MKSLLKVKTAIMMILCLVLFNCSMKILSKADYMKIGAKKNTSPPSNQMVVEYSGNVIPHASTFDFDSLSVSSGKTAEFTIINRGSGTLALTNMNKIILDNTSDYAVDVSGLEQEISPGASSKFSVTFISPDNNSAVESGSISIPNNFGAAYVINVKCTAGSPIQKIMTVDNNGAPVNNGTLIDFDSLNLPAGGKNIDLEIINNGDTGLYLTAPAKVLLDNTTDFQLSGLSDMSSPIRKGSPAKFGVKFISSAIDGLKKHGVVTIHNSFGIDYVIYLSCTAPAFDESKMQISNGLSVVARNGQFDFDSIDANLRDKPVTFTISNTANATLTIDSVTGLENNTNFKIDFSTPVIGPNSSATFTIQFVSAALDNAQKTAAISIGNNYGNPYTIIVECTAKTAATYTFTGSTTWSLPKYGDLVITCRGAGGGGGGNGGSFSYPGSGEIPGGIGAGGGAGYLNSNSFYNVQVNTFISISIGAGGQAGGNGVDGYADYSSIKVQSTAGQTGGIGGATTVSFDYNNHIVTASGGNGGTGGGAAGNESGGYGSPGAGQPSGSGTNGGVSSNNPYGNGGIARTNGSSGVVFIQWTGFAVNNN